MVMEGVRFSAHGDEQVRRAGVGAASRCADEHESVGGQGLPVAQFVGMRCGGDSEDGQREGKRAVASGRAAQVLPRAARHVGRAVDECVEDRFELSRRVVDDAATDLMGEE